MLGMCIYVCNVLMSVYASADAYACASVYIVLKSVESVVSNSFIIFILQLKIIRSRPEK